MRLLRHRNRQHQSGDQCEARRRMVAEQSPCGGIDMRNEDGWFVDNLSIRKGLALASVRDKLSWSRLVEGNWRFHSTVYGVGELTLHDVCAEGYVSVHGDGQMLTLTETGQAALDAMARLKGSSVVGMTVRPHPRAPQAPF